MDQPGPNRWTLQTSEEEANGCRILVLRGRDAVKLTFEFAGAMSLIVAASRTEALARFGLPQGN